MTEVLVVGGGPAGSAAATLLARWGHSVTLVTKPAAGGLGLGESIPPSTLKLFDVLGIRDRVDDGGFVRSSGNTVWWGSDTPRVEYFANRQLGWQVSNLAFERLLQDAARAAGARTAVAQVAPHDARVHAADFVLDCSGRAGVFARARGLREAHGTRTVAMVGLWQAETFDLPEPTHTLIASYEGGWAWSVPRTLEQRFVAVMVDPRNSQLPKRQPSRAVYAQEIHKVPVISRMLKGARLIGAVRGWDASMYGARRYVDGRVLLVGDAGSFIDPLSSAGIKKALASGWLAAVVTHTSLVRPEMRQVALDFFEAREREVYRSFSAMTEEFWREAASSHRHPFWHERVADQAVTAEASRVASTFERVRTSPALRVARAPDVRVAARPAVSGAEIVLEQRLVRHADDSGVRYLYDVDVLALSEIAPQHTSVPALYEGYNRSHAPVPLPDFLAALATALAQQWLHWCDTN